MKGLGRYITLGIIAVSLLACRPPEVLDPLEPETLEEKDCAFTPIHFEGNSLIISTSSMPRLKTMAECIRVAFRPIKLSGHSDRMGSRSYREEVGRNRAKTVKEALIKHGVVRELITTTSYGSNRMVCSEDHKRCAPVNRRVTIEFQ